MVYRMQLTYDEVVAIFDIVFLVHQILVTQYPQGYMKIVLLT